MSSKTVNWALYDAPMPLNDKGKPDPTARFVLVALADPANDDGTETFPSPLRLHWATGLDERTVVRALARLQKAGLIVPDGVSRYGTKKWRLAIERRRGDAFELHLEEAQKARRADSERRQADRNKAAVEAATKALSGTQNPGHESLSGTESPGQPTDVRDAKSRRPGVSVPAAGTQRPPNRKEPLVTGGTLPPDPLRGDDPQAGRLNDSVTSPPEAGTSQLGPAGDPPPARASPGNVIDFASRRRKDHPPGEETA